MKNGPKGIRQAQVSPEEEKESKAREDDSALNISASKKKKEVLSR